jgi:ribosomal protein S27E
MPFSANCPACGAPVVFRSSASFHGVCEFCRSTLVRHGGNLENLGRMADLLEDASPIRLGTEGRYKGVHFAVIGRIQLRYAAGIWNEWHVLFDDMRSGWLSDANGEYLISFLTPPGGQLPAFAGLMPNEPVSIAGREFVVGNVEEAMCVSGEGELPFAFGAGYPAQLADLREIDGSGFASIDYSEAPPLVFVGESLPFAAFGFANLRGEATARPAGVVATLQCPRCGSAIGIHDKAVQSVACPSCLTLLENDNKSLRVLQKAAAATRIEPMIPLGSVGRFHGKDWTVIGFQERAVTVEGKDYPWQEFLLHHPEEGFRWLVESTGHWTWVSPLAGSPRYTVGIPSVTHMGTEFRRFSVGSAVTRYVIGEFNWKVTVGETWELTDFIAPPRMLSREASHNEITWSLGDYLPVEEVAAAFKLDHALPEPVGIAMNQPNPREAGHRSICRRFWIFLVVTLLAQALWIFILGGKTLVDQRVVFAPDRDEPLATQSFQLPDGARNLVLRQDTDVDNNWIGISLTLVEKASGRAWAAVGDIAYWHGNDGGESWSEGERSRELVFRDLPPGEYYFVVDPEISAEKPVAVADRIRVVQNQPAWSSFFLLLGYLALFPMFSRYRVAAFEAKRWEDADFLSSGAEFGSEGDSDGDSDSGGGD